MKPNPSRNKKTNYKASPEACERYPDAPVKDIKFEKCPICEASFYDPCIDKRGRELGKGRFHRARIAAANRTNLIEELRRDFDKKLVDGDEALKARLSWSEKDGPSISKYGKTARGMGLEFIWVGFPVRQMVYRICENPEYRALLFEYLAIEASTQEKIENAQRLRS